MARTVESDKCNAWIEIGNGNTWAILPCRRWGNGRCLRDLRTEAGIPNRVSSGQCAADQQGQQAPKKPKA